MDGVLRKGMFFDDLSCFKDLYDQSLSSIGGAGQFHLAGTQHIQTDTEMAFVKHDLAGFIGEWNSNAMERF